jgi:hypothetical protein
MLSSHKPADDMPALQTPAENTEGDPPRRPLRIRVHRPSHTIETIQITDDDARIQDIIAVRDDLIFLDDDDEPIDVKLTLAQAISGRGRHHEHHDIHQHPCRWITAHISYGDATETLQAAPSSRVESVRRRALDKFGLTTEIATTLVLRVSDTGTYLRHGDYLSDLIGREPCRLDLNLIPSS